MDVPIITFEEIIKLNGHDWDQAYAVLNYHLDKGNIKKEVLESGMVIYHNPTRVQGHNLIYNKYSYLRLTTISWSALDGD
ncbi:hypothetical protein [Algoriphagus aquimarinus]|uniref:hypothetical protein n=1 Tax=Algoriphagus aquimarinus TaxID=237018 RepID=UPI0030D88919|tara:strand:+ start:182428 stop:182667 length:240 start_codon:yes stop_codon:yes gene_type:complete